MLINKQKEILENAKKVLPKEELKILEQSLSAKKKRVFERFPMLFTLLGTFGLVATLYGFEKIIDQTFLVNHPIILLLTGVVILFFTGLLYKKL